MTTLEELLGTQQKPLHPKINYWKSKIGEGERAVITIRTTQNIATPVPQKIYFRVFDAANDETFNDTDTWDLLLNEQLIDLNIKAGDLKDEALRFAFMIPAELKSAELRYGNNYVSSILYHLLKDVEDLRDKIPNLKEIKENKPYKQDSAYEYCLLHIKNSIINIFDKLQDKLHYNHDESIQIVADALNLHLDVRYAISNRKFFGFR